MTIFLIGLCLLIAYLLRCLIRERRTWDAALVAAYDEAEDARAEVARIKRDNAESETAAAKYYDHALGTLRGEVAEREALILTLAAEFAAAWNAERARHEDELGMKRAAKRRPKAVSS